MKQLSPKVSALVVERERLERRLQRARTHAEHLELVRRVDDAHSAVRRQVRLEQAQAEKT